MRRALVLLPVLALLAGCGDDGDGAAGRTAAATRPATPPAAAPTTTERVPATPPALRLPPGVPRRPTGPTDTASVRVVQRWSAALRAGRVIRAARYFGLPSRVQNGTPVLVLRRTRDRLAFNAGLPCGAVPTGFAGARGWTIVTFRLVQRTGGDCGGAAGHVARCAIRVRDGRIVAWFRLPDPAPQATAPSSAGAV